MVPPIETPGCETDLVLTGIELCPYLKPSKRLMADLFVSKKALDHIIQTANQFFMDLRCRVDCRLDRKGKLGIEMIGVTAGASAPSFSSIRVRHRRVAS